MKPAVRIVLSIVVLIAVAAGAFLGGTLYGKNQAQAQIASQRNAFFRNQGDFQPGAAPLQGGLGQGQNGQNGAARRTSGTGGAFGTIELIGEGTLTIADQNGKKTEVKVTDTTLIEKQASVTLKDLAQGDTVIVSGTAGSDGVVTARSVQVAPAGRFGFGGPGGAGGQAPGQAPGQAAATPAP